MSYIIVDKPNVFRVPLKFENKNLIRVLAQHEDSYVKSIKINVYATELLVKAPKEFMQMAQVCAGETNERN